MKNSLNKLGVFLYLIGFLVSLSHIAMAETTLESVQTRGSLNCGVTDSQSAFARIDQNGKWAGFDIDFCKAIAAAVLGKPESVNIIPLGTSVRFEALLQGEIDVLLRNTTWTLSRDAKMDLDFAGITYFDGQGFIARKTLGATKAADLKNQNLSVCVIKNTTSYQNLKDFIETSGYPWKIEAAETFEGSHEALFQNICDMFTSDITALLSLQSNYPAYGTEFSVLSDVISREPLGPAVRTDDKQWFDIVKWVVQSVIIAEELKLNSANVDAMSETTSNLEAKRLLGLEPGFGEMLGLDDRWGYRVIKMIGNYADIYDRNFGTGSKLNLERNLNKLWSDGGLHYPLPFR
jgi:general L-amino acid transport system substrate-binding protein